MERVKLFFAIAALLALIAAVVGFASPYDPVVGPFLPIEQLWEIEDAREESEAPLVTALSCNGVPLAYDRAENTFYCTLGPDQGSEWPALHLTAPGAKGVSLCFSDDYTFDSCADAVQSGLRYELMAYTDSEYAYFDLVFTGLPLVSIETETPIAREDTPVQVTLSAFGEEPVVTHAVAHIRGASSATRVKQNLTLRFLRSASGKKNTVAVPGIGPLQQVILCGMEGDETLLRDSLSWALYDELLGAQYSGALDARRTQYCELFVNGEYRGLYLLMEPIFPEEELLREGNGAPLSDSLYRTMVGQFAGERPFIENADEPGTVFELRYAPPHRDSALDFTPLEPYIALLGEPDDEAFAARAEALLDMDSLLRYGILCQAGGFCDNVHNNLYIWAHHSAQGLVYRFAPWDMDVTWGKRTEMIGYGYDRWVAFPLLDRVLLLDVADARSRYARLWRQYRESVLSEENVTALITALAEPLTVSGALGRNAARWGLSVEDTAGYALVSFAQQRLPVIDQAVERLLSEASPTFLDPDWRIGDELYPAIFPEE